MSLWAVFLRHDMRFLAESASGCAGVIFLRIRWATVRAMGLFRLRADVLSVADVFAPLTNLSSALIRPAAYKLTVHFYIVWDACAVEREKGIFGVTN